MTAPLRRLAALVAGVLLAALLTACDFDGAYDLPLPGSPVDADDSYEVTAEFEDILNVVPRSPVMVDDVVVGEVTEVERVGWHAKVWLRIRDDVELPANVVALTTPEVTSIWLGATVSLNERTKVLPGVSSVAPQ